MSRLKTDSVCLTFVLGHIFLNVLNHVQTNRRGEHFGKFQGALDGSTISGVEYRYNGSYRCLYFINMRIGLHICERERETYHFFVLEL